MNGFEPQLIQLSIFFPMGMAFLLLVWRNIDASMLKAVATLGFLVPCVCAIALTYKMYGMDVIGSAYLFQSEIDTGFKQFGISLKLGLNGVSAPMFLLSGIVGLAAGLFALQSGAERLRVYLFLLLFMQSGLMGVFSSIDIFFFYFFHEFALIPTFVMVGWWGGQGRRSAAMELTIYLTCGAMLSLMGLMALYMSAYNSSAASFSFDFIHLKELIAQADISEFAYKNIFALLLFGFGILVSLWPFHSWAPKGYAAAPSSAAMLHAGVLKKFGLYGLIQLVIPVMPTGLAEWSPMLVWLALGNIVIIGFVTMAQRDLKMMVGYASVMHMGYAFIGIATYSVIGIGGVVMFMFAHGLSAALLFLLSTSIYNRTNTYDMTEMGGLGQKTPILAGCFVAATMASIGLPGFANFWGELVIFISIWEKFSWAVPAVVAGVVISAIYGLRSVAKIFFGKPTSAFAEQYESGKIKDITSAERLPIVILFLGLLLVGLWPQSISRKMNEALADSVYAGESSQKVLKSSETPSAKEGSDEETLKAKL